jgi:hypothetical protein
LLAVKEDPQNQVRIGVIDFSFGEGSQDGDLTGFDFHDFRPDASEHGDPFYAGGCKGGVQLFKCFRIEGNIP